MKNLFKMAMIALVLFAGMSEMVAQGQPPRPPGYDVHVNSVTGPSGSITLEYYERVSFDLTVSTSLVAGSGTGGVVYECTNIGAYGDGDTSINSSTGEFSVRNRNLDGPEHTQTYKFRAKGTDGVWSSEMSKDITFEFDADQ